MARSSTPEWLRRRAWLPILPLVCQSCTGTSSEAPRAAPAAGREPIVAVLTTWYPRHFEVIQESLARFTRETGIPVKYVPAPSGKPDRVNQYLAWLKERKITPDVFQADVTEIGMLAPHMVDLAPDLGDAASRQIPAIMQNHWIDGRLVAMPLYTDIGVLLYRTDLLSKYGYPRPPESWKELAEMAARIQAGERAAGNHDFWGFVWAGQRADDLICLALELQASFGGGTIIERDRSITVNNPRTMEALLMAKRWVGTISPSSVTVYRIEDARGLWFSGNAAFLRSWSGDHARQAAYPPIRGKLDIAVPPRGRAGHFGTLGGWQLSVSQYSQRTREAVELVRFLTRREEQRARAVALSALPVFLDLYDDPQVLETNAHISKLKDLLLHGAVARPSAVSGAAYFDVADSYAKAVHTVLIGEKGAAEALAELESELIRITGFRPRGAETPGS